MKTLNFLNKMNEILSSAKNGVDSNSIVDEMYRLCVEKEYDSICDGYIYDSETIVEDLKYFLSVGDVIKSRFLCYVLNTHYKGATSKLMEDLLTEEKYELCAVLSKVIDTVELPSEK